MDCYHRRVSRHHTGTGLRELHDAYDRAEIRHSNGYLPSMAALVAIANSEQTGRNSKPNSGEEVKQSENDRDVALDLWAEESGAELAAGACTRGSASTAGTASCPISTAGCATTAGSAC